MKPNKFTAAIFVGGCLISSAAFYWLPIWAAIVAVYLTLKAMAYSL